MNTALLRSILDSYHSDHVDRTMSPTESMPGDNYFWVGETALHSILGAIGASRLSKIETVLDLPCGHGRVLRHLVCALPQAAYHVCDLDAAGLVFCAATFGARPIPSREDLTSVSFDSRYDLIWIGSLFTHTSYAITKKWLTYLSDLLTDHGIIVATFHGRVVPSLQPILRYTDDHWHRIVQEYEATGYGYQDYDVPQRHAFIEAATGSRWRGRACWSASSRASRASASFSIRSGAGVTITT